MRLQAAFAAAGACPLRARRVNKGASAEMRLRFCRRAGGEAIPGVAAITLLLASLAAAAAAAGNWRPKREVLSLRLKKN